MQGYFLKSSNRLYSMTANRLFMVVIMEDINKLLYLIILYLL